MRLFQKPGPSLLGDGGVQCLLENEWRGDKYLHLFSACLEPLTSFSSSSELLKAKELALKFSQVHLVQCSVLHPGVPKRPCISLACGQVQALFCLPTSFPLNAEVKVHTCI